MTPLNTRDSEIEKYQQAYLAPSYLMKGQRAIWARQDLEALTCRGSYLDVSCGRGQMLDFAQSIGFAVIAGTEVVDYLTDGARVLQAPAWALPFPDKSFEVVSFFDVWNTCCRATMCWPAANCFGWPSGTSC